MRVKLFWIIIVYHLYCHLSILLSSHVGVRFYPRDRKLARLSFNSISDVVQQVGDQGRLPNSAFSKISLNLGLAFKTFVWWLFTWRLLFTGHQLLLNCLELPLLWFFSKLFLVGLTFVTGATIYVALSSLAFWGVFGILEQIIKVDFLWFIVHIDPACLSSFDCYFVMCEPVEVGSESLDGDLGALEAGLSFQLLFVYFWLGLWLFNHDGAIVETVFKHLGLLIAHILAECFVSYFTDLNEFFFKLNWH